MSEQELDHSPRPRFTKLNEVRYLEAGSGCSTESTLQGSLFADSNCHDVIRAGPATFPSRDRRCKPLISTTELRTCRGRINANVEWTVRRSIRRQIFHWKGRGSNVLLLLVQRTKDTLNCRSSGGSLVNSITKMWNDLQCDDQTLHKIKRLVMASGESASATSAYAGCKLFPSLPAFQYIP